MYTILCLDLETSSNEHHKTHAVWSIFKGPNDQINLMILQAWFLESHLSWFSEPEYRIIMLILSLRSPILLVNQAL